MKIKRIWHGWTAPENADAYQELLHRVIFPGIEAKNMRGFRSVELFRKDLGEEVEFITIMTFDSLKDVKDFAGKDYERSYIPDEAKKVLKRWDIKAAHFELIETRNYPVLG